MGSLPDPPGEFNPPTHPPPPPSLDEFQKQTSLMTTCTLLWKELTDHFTWLEQTLLTKSNSLSSKLQTLDAQTTHSLQVLEHRELTIDDAVSIQVKKAEESKSVALISVGDGNENENDVVGEVDDSEGLLMRLRFYCRRMDGEGIWRFVTGRKKELEGIRAQMPVALGDCVDPARFWIDQVTRNLSPVSAKMLRSWLMLLYPFLGNSRLLVTPSMKERAKEIAETWKKSLDQRGGIENVKTPDVHTFLQHLITFGIVKKEDIDLYRKLVVGSAWRRQMPKLAVSLGLGDKMPDMIEELISRGQQVDAVHFTFEVGLEDRFPPVPLLKAFLKDARKAADSIVDDPNNSGRATFLAARKEQSALRAVIKCIEEYKLEAEFPSGNLRKRLEQLEKTKSHEKRKPSTVPANKRTRANNGGPMPPAKAGRSTNAYVSSFPVAPTHVRSPSHTQYPAAVVPQYPAGPGMYGSRSPPSNLYAYSPEAGPHPFTGSYQVPPMSYPPYGSYGNGVAPVYHQAYYR
ncbi:hypothetical protein RHGRI_003443 [Rhododendron griersonianum]|uniref:FRIGIDA-like protein n=1 Tax=Rhododendron griersonianum TaxID=479676 RepID=A0AAV6L504_9ERIC|nr:hypothetical protein RHGRI_003443 [Rhododendron griersonianum]